MVQGIKSKFFSCYWDSMFLSAMIYPSKIDEKNLSHLKTMKEFKRYYNSFKYIIPCKFCREFIKDVLEPTLPLDFSGRISLMKSLYLWKNRVNIKLLLKNCSFTKPSPPFKEILDKYETMRAKCDKKIGKCV
jgi:hypothetical protein